PGAAPGSAALHARGHHHQHLHAGAEPHPDGLRGADGARQPWPRLLRHARPPRRVRPRRLRQEQAPSRLVGDRRRKVRATYDRRVERYARLAWLDMAELLDAIEIETAPAPRAAVIWMHGLGAD